MPAPTSGTSYRRDSYYRHHGTAVVGVLAAEHNGFGVSGIAPGAAIRAMACGDDFGSSEAIVKAAALLRTGDIIVIELHRPGPRYNFNQSKQDGYIPIEWWPDDLAAIQYAVSLGIVVVAAGGNGGDDLDDKLYDANPTITPWGKFPTTWTNPFRRSPVDSGAILVGAGASARSSATDEAPRSRLDFSNYGGCIDAQGWGENVVTTGYGDLQGGSDEDRFYTHTFAGTSSATPIVAGALACVQGIRDATGQPRLTPAAARKLLRTTGSPQQTGSVFPITQRIGNLPSLGDMLNGLVATTLVAPPVSPRPGSINPKPNGGRRPNAASPKKPTIQQKPKPLRKPKRKGQ